jgi:hypothetical protein
MVILLESSSRLSVAFLVDKLFGHVKGKLGKKRDRDNDLKLIRA